ncbi:MULTISPECIES: hypothetical protein [Deinococcus]|nr:hypothetical protein [Deinococcus metallilatus]MBB5296158.1 hypothetical protein [Deinococcus metallilatus]GMA14024.1 hypothetical protein GCM10025871_03550 [Deinococcus metallilatus]
MKALRAPLLTLLALGGGAMLDRTAASPSVPALPVGWQGRLGALLPQPGQTVQLMEQRASLAFVELQQRVTTVGGSRDALRALMFSAAKGEPLEYDERLGITQEEFRRYVVFPSVLAPTGKTARLNVVREGNRLKFGDTPGLNGVLRGLVLDLGTGELHTPEGFGSKPRPVPPSTAPDRTIDIRGGFEWNVKGNSPVTQNGVKGQLQLLQLAGNQVILKYYRFSMLRGVTSEGSIILSYTR